MQKDDKYEYEENEAFESECNNETNQIDYHVKYSR